MRRITHLVVHATGGPQSQTVDSILNYWRKVKKWRARGYNILITPSGERVRLAADASITNGVRGRNATILNVAYIGGRDSAGRYVDTRTPEQRAALIAQLQEWRALYPQAEICGHRDFSPDLDGDGVVEFHEFIKACPCFDARAEYASL